MKIGVKNFRIFNDRMDFDIRPLTIFTGPNNAGKSALAKLFMLLKNNATVLNFDIGIHRIPNFEKAINFESDSKYFAITLNHKIDFFKDIKFGVFYADAECKAIKTYVDDVEIFSADTLNYFLTISFDYKKVIDIYLAREYIIPVEFDSIGDAKKYVLAKNCQIDFENYPNVNFSNYQSIDTPSYKNIQPKVTVTFSLEDWSSNLHETTDYEELLSANALYNETEKLILEETPYALFDVYRDSEKVTAQFYEKIVELQGNKLQISEDGIVYDVDYNKLFLDRLDFLSNEIKEFLMSEFPEQRFKVKPSLSNHLIFREGFVGWMRGQPYDNPKLFWHLTNSISHLKNTIRNAAFVTINRGLQFTTTDNPNYELLKNYAKSKKVNKGEFIRKALTILGLEADVIINQVNLLNGIGIADILLESEKGSQTLQDLGYGFSMLLPILIQIELGGSPIFIEEPEANLHPNYQSKLADIFILANEMFPDTKIILETHSEYLVRRLQYLTASGKVNTKSSIIYYFNSDNNVSQTNPKIIPIEILSNGTMTEEFGPGFYDEASRLRFDLLKLDDNSSN